VAPNSAVATIKAPLWGLLLERIGDLVMLYLLRHASLFSPLPNRCYLQIAGAPIHKYVPHVRGLVCRPFWSFDRPIMNCWHYDIHIGDCCWHYFIHIIKFLHLKVTWHYLQFRVYLHGYILSHCLHS
jgi:hypothetical protein